MKVRTVLCMVTVAIASLFSVQWTTGVAQTVPVQPSFVRTDFGTQEEPSAIIAADFNRDGKLDLAVGGFTNGLISILPGNGDGTFRPKQDIPSYGFPVSMAVADYNKDGFTDLLVAGWMGTCVLLGNGDGTFSLPKGLYSEAAVSAATGDFNSDGKADAVWGTWDAAYISLGNGDGTFQKPIGIRADAWYTCIIAADLNKDGKLDLALTWNNYQTSGGVSILLGSGNGTFIHAGDFPSGGDATGSTVAGDLNGDSNLDLAIVNQVPGSVSFLRGNGDGSFAPPVDYMVTLNARAVDKADFDGDGVLDLAVTAKGILSILKGKGDGNFQQGVDLAVGAVEHNGILATDLNGDSKPDLVVANSPGPKTGASVSSMSSVSVFINATAGNNTPTALCKNVTVAAGPGCKASALIDAGSYGINSEDTLTLSQNPPGPYPLGQTNTTLTVTDARGASSQCSATVTVVDGTAPSISMWSATPGILWPVNGKMTPVNFTVGASDGCSGSVTCKISNITSNEPVGPGGDWVITGKLTANLRANRLGTGTGRKYTVTLECTDAAGNKTTKDAVVVVPHDEGK